MVRIAGTKTDGGPKVGWGEWAERRYKRIANPRRNAAAIKFAAPKKPKKPEGATLLEFAIVVAAIACLGTAAVTFYSQSLQAPHSCMREVKR